MYIYNNHKTPVFTIAMFGYCLKFKNSSASSTIFKNFIESLNYTMISNIFVFFTHTNSTEIGDEKILSEYFATKPAHKKVRAMHHYCSFKI